MACFLTPAVAAVLTTGMRKKIPSPFHIEWLNAMLWGGVLMLTVEHYAHGELILYPPFLTAMGNYIDILIMLKEMVTVGGTMTLAIVAVWIIMVFVYNKACNKREKQIINLKD
jgi:hypothetical protein